MSTPPCFLLMWQFYLSLLLRTTSQKGHWNCWMFSWTIAMWFCKLDLVNLMSCTSFHMCHRHEQYHPPCLGCEQYASVAQCSLYDLLPHHKLCTCTISLTFVTVKFVHFSNNSLCASLNPFNCRLFCHNSPTRLLSVIFVILYYTLTSIIFVTSWFISPVLLNVPPKVIELPK